MEWKIMRRRRQEGVLQTNRGAREWMQGCRMDGWRGTSKEMEGTWREMEDPRDRRMAIRGL